MLFVPALNMNIVLKITLEAARYFVSTLEQCLLTRKGLTVVHSVANKDYIRSYHRS